MSPRLDRQRGYLFYFRAAEVLIEPAHIHIEGEKGAMKIWIPSLEIAECYNIPTHEQNKLLDIVATNCAKWLAIWKQKETIAKNLN